MPDRPEEELEQIKAMDTEIAKGIRTLTERRRQRTSGIRRIVGTADEVDRHNIAADVLPHEFRRLEHYGIETRRMVDGKDTAPLGRARDHRVAFGDGIGHRLLDKDVAAHIERLQGERAVRSWRCENVHHIELCGAHLVGRAVDGPHAVFRGHFASAGFVCIADGGDLHKGQIAHGAQMMIMPLRSRRQ